MAGVHKTTILRLLKEVGDKCARLLDEQMRGLTCRVIEADQVWAFVKKKQRWLTPEEKLNPQLGDQYAYIALDPDTKLVPVFVVGKRDSATTLRFIRELRNRLANRIQMSTDAFRPYVERNDLTIRMQLRRFPRLTNGFSKKLNNLKAALALHFAWYNFCRIHGSLRVTPAMAAGITDRVWDLRKLL
jgi:IS1 family transposase